MMPHQVTQETIRANPELAIAIMDDAERRGFAVRPAPYYRRPWNFMVTCTKCTNLLAGDEGLLALLCRVPELQCPYCAGEDNAGR